MKCNNCGNEILENSKFCPNCGTPVSVVQNNEEPVQSISNENSQNLSNNNENSIENIETVESSAFVSSNNDIPNTNLEQAVDNNINNQVNDQLETNDFTNTNEESVINKGLNQSVEEPITSNTEINSIQPNTNQVNEQPIVYEQPSTNIVNNNKENNSTNIISDNNASISSNKKEKTIGYGILGFLLPLVGLIVFFAIRKDKPKSAKASLIGAIISFVLSIIISVILTVLPIIKGVNSLSGNNIITTNSTVNSKTTTTNTINNNWKDYTISINGKTLSLPVSYEELKNASGFSIKSVYDNTTIPTKHYVLANLYKDDKLAVSVELTNKTDSDLKYVDSSVTRISQDKFSTEQTGIENVIFPGNLKTGMNITKEEIFKLFGEIEVKEYKSDNYVSETYKYTSDDTWKTLNYYEIRVVNGVIDSLTLDHRN